MLSCLDRCYICGFIHLNICGLSRPDPALVPSSIDDQQWNPPSILRSSSLPLPQPSIPNIPKPTTVGGSNSNGKSNCNSYREAGKGQQTDARQTLTAYQLVGKRVLPRGKPVVHGIGERERSYRVPNCASWPLQLQQPPTAAKGEKPELVATRTLIHWRALESHHQRVNTTTTEGPFWFDLACCRTHTERARFVPFFRAKSSRFTVGSI